MTDLAASVSGSGSVHLDPDLSGRIKSGSTIKSKRPGPLSIMPSRAWDAAEASPKINQGGAGSVWNGIKLRALWDDRAGPLLCVGEAGSTLEGRILRLSGVSDFDLFPSDKAVRPDR